MTKKIFAMFLAVLMVVSMLPTSVFAAGTCPGKGEHTLENCTYTQVKVTAPTCGDMGFTTYKCDVCGETFAESWVAATGEHQWTDLEAQAPTCAKPGYEAGQKCAVCGKKVPGAEIPQLDKDATECEWVDKTPYINCETGGVKKFECAFCGATWELEVEAGEHTWDNANPKLVKPATLTENGVAEVTCTTCLEVKEVEVLFTHTHDYSANRPDYIFEYEEVPADCTTGTAGMKSYMQCRICDAVNFKRGDNWGWYQLTEAEWKSLVIEPDHEYDHEPTCVDTVLTCTKCGASVPQNIEHDIDWENWNWNGEGEYVLPTCSSTGYMASWCKVCEKFRDVKILANLGHKEVTVNVPATCVSNAYSFTYCARTNCVNAIDAAKLPAGYAMEADVLSAITAPVVGEGFYLASEQLNNGYVVYFTGAMNGNYLATSYDVAEAVLVYLEIVHPRANNAYYMYFYNAEGVKTYIEAYTYNTAAGKVGVRLTATPSNVWSWDANLGTVVCAVTTEKYGKDFYVVRTNDNYDTMGVTYDGDSKLQFVAVLGETGVKAPVNVINYNVVKNSIDANAHNMTSQPIVAPTCTEAGLKQVWCLDCGGANDIVEVAPDHDWYELTGEITVNNKKVAASRDADCEDGWQYFKCSLCEETKKVTYAGYGHVLGDVIKQTPDHKNTVVYDYQKCIYCGDDTDAEGKLVGYRVNVTKKTWNDANKHWDDFDAANKAHGYTLTGAGTVVKKGDCKEYGLKLYTCGDPDCKKAVYVKIAGTGEHVMPAGTAYLEPTCTTKGHLATYQCERCDAIVGNAKLGELNEIKALGHTWAEIEDYEASDCDKPDYYNYKFECETCGLKKTDGTTELKTVEFVNGNPCETIAFEYYLCHCGEEHMISFITKLGHEMVELPRYDADGNAIAANFKAPTCYETGYTTFVCAFCGVPEVKTLNMVEHENAAKEKFTDKCTDTVTDRHCVVCHEHYGHDSKGNAHDCTKLDANKDGKLDCLGECMIGQSCHYSVDKNMPSTCLQDAYTLKVCADCKDQIVIPNTEFKWNGHKPASNVETYYENEDGEVVAYVNGPQPTYLAGYVYDDNFVWYSVELDKDGNFVQYEEAYTAKYIEYVPATYTANGYAKMYCQECKAVVTQIIPKLTGLGFELNVSNANGATEFTYGSLVEVVVTANALNTGVYGFNFDVDYTAGLVYVGFETVNDDFIFTVTNPEKAVSYVDIVGRAANDANGKMQNVQITEGTALVKLFFRVNTPFASTEKFVFDSDYAKAYEVKNNKTVEIDCSYFAESIKTRTFLDFNKDGSFHVTDLYLAMTLLTGEHVSGMTYDVTMDLNKDGEVTLEELSIAYNFYVGNYELDDLFSMGISEAELELIMGADALHCVQCGGEIAGYETYCPHCGRNPR